MDLSDGVVFGSTAVYTCTDQQLFTLEGDANRTCLISGVWSGAEPTCNCKSTLKKSSCTLKVNCMNEYITKRRIHASESPKNLRH